MFFVPLLFLPKFLFKTQIRSSCCGAMGLVASWECWDAGLIPGLTQRVKDPALPLLRLRVQLWLGSDPWPGNSICHGTAKKEKKKKKQIMCYLLWKALLNSPVTVSLSIFFITSGFLIVICVHIVSTFYINFEALGD